jgi:hypothetical protein
MAHLTVIVFNVRTCNHTSRNQTAMFFSATLMTSGAIAFVMIKRVMLELCRDLFEPIACHVIIFLLQYLMGYS